MRFTRLLLVLLLATPAVRAATEQATAMPPATLRELAQLDVAPPTVVHVHRRSHSSSIGETMMPEVFTPAPESIAAPAVTTKFQDESDPSVVVPADAGGAVSPQYVVSVNNKAVSVRDRSGNQILRTTNGQFWFDPTIAGGVQYDSRISYDAKANRFVIAALFDQGQGNNSTLLFAATATGDPTGTWYRYRLVVDTTNRTSADFTRLALGTSKAIITANIYGSSGFDPLNATVYTVPLSLLYAGAAAPIATSSNTTLIDVAPVAVMDANDPSVWIASTNSAGLTVYDVTNATTVMRVSAPIPITTSYTTNYGQQLGSNVLMDTGDMVPQNAVIRNHVLWTVQTAQPAVGALRTSIALWRVDIATHVLRWLLVDDPSGATTYAFPSMAVNRNGAALLAYAQYNATYYPSAAYTYVDPAGNSSDSTFLRQGDAAYKIDRWADFTTAVVDPVDDTGFWTVQVVPLKPIPIGQVWATWWFNIPLNTPPAKRRAARH